MMRAGHDLYKMVSTKIIYDEIVVLIGPGNNGGTQYLLLFKQN